MVLQSKKESKMAVASAPAELKAFKTQESAASNSSVAAAPLKSKMDALAARAAKKTPKKKTPKKRMREDGGVLPHIYLTTKLTHQKAVSGYGCGGGARRGGKKRLRRGTNNLKSSTAGQGSEQLDDNDGVGFDDINAKGVNSDWSLSQEEEEEAAVESAWWSEDMSSKSKSDYDDSGSGSGSGTRWRKKEEEEKKKEAPVKFSSTWWETFLD